MKRVKMMWASSLTAHTCIIRARRGRCAIDTAVPSAGIAVAEAAPCPPSAPDNEVGCHTREVHSESKGWEGHWDWHRYQPRAHWNMDAATRSVCGVDDDVVSTAATATESPRVARSLLPAARQPPQSRSLRTTSATATPGIHQARDIRDCANLGDNLKPSSRNSLF